MTCANPNPNPNRRYPLPALTLTACARGPALTLTLTEQVVDAAALAGVRAAEAVDQVYATRGGLASIALELNAPPALGGLSLLPPAGEG